jgi:cytoplasmic iron level regulating protein YaaA (DUF328/UPF0246 family)
MSKLVILLPPSESKKPGGRRGPWQESKMSVPAEAQRLAVMGALALALEGTEADLSKLFGVKGDALADAARVNAAVATSPTMAAIERYTGVLYGALDAASLDPLQRRRFNRQVRIFSGLWGAVGPSDPIPNYKLKMGATLPGLSPSGTTRLSRFWRPGLTEALQDSMKIDRQSVLWNLLPNDCADALGPLPPRRQFSVRFFEADAAFDHDPSQLRVVNHWNKLLKGSLVRWLLNAQPTDVAALEAFDHPLGYRWMPEFDDATGATHVAALVRMESGTAR